jgi:hypothetical protein
MSQHTSEEWFEDIQVEGQKLSHVSKFWRADFTVSLHEVENLWPSWSLEEKESFAFAFSKRPELNDEDEKLLTYIIVNGEPRIWCDIALLATRSRDRGQAIDFLVARVKEGSGTLANYYQALGKLEDPRTISVLKEAFAQHTETVRVCSLQHPSTYRFAFLDYLACCAALLLITRDSQYRHILLEMSHHQNTTVRKLARVVAAQSGIIVA